MLPPRGYLFIFLNAVRFLSVIGLLLVFASNVLVLADDIKAVNRFVAEGSNNQLTTLSANGTVFDCEMDYIEGSTVPNQAAGVFWAVVNRLLILFEVIVLLLSEFNWPRVFFDTWFPVLGADFGLGPLGVFECLISAAVLSHRVDTFPNVAAFFLFSIGCLNILLGLIFRGKGRSKRSLSAWKDTKDVLPSVNGRATPSFTAPSFGRSSREEGDLTEKAQSLGFGRQLSSAGHGFGVKGEKAAGLKGFLITKPLETLPRYAPKPSAGDSRSSSPTFTSSATAV